MKPKEFLNRVLPDGVHYVAYPSDKQTDSGRPIYFHKSFNETVEGIAQAQAIATTKDVYFTPAAYKVAKVFDEKKGYTKSYRKQDNVASLKSFYVDVDYKSYGSEKEALRAVRAFMDTMEIPKPNIAVASGGGIHLYWVLDRAVTPGEWMPVAKALASYTQRHELRADLQVTIDTARILRLPGTKNHKYDDKPECKVVQSREADIDFDRFREALSDYTGQTELDPEDFQAGAEVVQLFSGGNDALAHGYDPGQTYHMSRLVDYCPTMAGIIERGGEGDSYSLWKNALHLAAYCEDGREYIHAVSSKHKDYNPEEVEERFAESVKVQQEGSRGPTTCELFSKHSPACLNCKYFGHIKSPISLGRKNEQRETSDITYTLPGRTCMNVEDQDGEPKRVNIANCEIEDWQIGFDRELGQVMSFKYKVKDRKKLFVFPVSTLADHRKMHGLLLQAGVSVQQKQLKLLAEAAVSWLERLQSVQHYEDEHPFGWTNDGKGFAVAGKVYRGNEVRDAGMCDPSFEANYSPTGALAEWQEALRPLVEDDRREVHTMIASSFASPLLEFTEINAFTVSFTSLNSGVGKSTVLRAAQSIWAEPVKSMGGLNDTSNSSSKKMAYARFMPLCYDELRGVQEMQDFAKLIFRAAQGKERQRMYSNATLRAAEDINSVIIAASNHSVVEAVSEHTGDSNAGVLRMFEVAMPKHSSGREESLNISAAAAKLRSNYGVAGREYIKGVTRDPEKVAKIYSQTLDWLTKKVDATADERFWTQAGAAFIAGAALAKSFGVIDLDVGKVRDCVIDMIKEGRERTKSVEAASKNHVSRIVEFARDYLLITDDDDPKMTIAVASPPPRRVAKMQIAIKSGQLYISRNLVRDYAKQNGLVMAHVEESLLDTADITRIQYSIGQGTQDYANPSGPCYKANATKVLGSGVLSRWMASVNS